MYKGKGEKKGLQIFIVTCLAEQIIHIALVGGGGGGEEGTTVLHS